MCESFEKAAEDVLVLKNRPKNSDLADLYGLYKQATVGDVNIACPMLLMDFAGNHKWKAWNAKKGITKDEAMTQYVDLVEKLKKES
ncbi:acyl-CoA-binding domain-containing protein 7-like [Notolabrus celidotus]|uniref:acyl-CoA-binding domain-containing protein 7-like n=1 Tax=Notolabrus celidotus TaxID=1203425 RepID=UPI00148F9200|nr:acyl-CoA-binding domain-containing protein 7-like [Notolabrus celidotus]